MMANKKTISGNPWSDQKVLTVKNQVECKEAINQLKLELNEYNVLGLHCEYKIRKGSSRIVLLQLVSYNGLVVLFRLCFHHGILFELKKILENDQIVKVDAANSSQLLIDNHGIKVASTIDLSTLTTLSGCKPLLFSRMCKVYLKLDHKMSRSLRAKSWCNPELEARQIEFAAISVRATIELFKGFAQKLQPDCQLNAKNVRCIIEKHCKQFFVTPCKRTKAKFGNRIYKFLDDDCCMKLLETLISHCDEYNIIGFDCEIDILTIKTNICNALLNLASYDGTSVFIRLSENSMTASIELKKLLEDSRIVKVGILPEHCATNLKCYGINPKSMFDLRYMAESCGIQPDSLGVMLRKLIEDQSVATRNNVLISNHAQAAVQLFRAFLNKLQPKATQQHLHQQSAFLQNIINNFCAHNFDKDYKPKEDRLKVERICVVEDTHQCSLVIKEIKTHCAEYNVLGLDCEYVYPSNVSLLQLATHRGLCVLIRLCFFKTLPTEVKEILEDAKIIKVGKAVFSDAEKLLEEFGAQVASLLDVGSMASICGFRDGGLGTMTKTFLNAYPYKTKSMSCSNWEKFDLSEGQRSYAAKDAQAGIELFKFFAEKLEINLKFNIETDYVNYVIAKYFASSVRCITYSNFALESLY